MLCHFLKAAIVEDLASAPTASYPDGSIARRESWLPLSSSAWKFLGKGSGWPSLGHMGISWANLIAKEIRFHDAAKLVTGSPLWLIEIEEGREIIEVEISDKENKTDK